MNTLIKPAKTILAKRFGYKNVSVNNGTDSAWGWVRIKVLVDKPTNCLGESPFTCKVCRENNNKITSEVYNLVGKEWKRLGLKPSTYTSDDGYNTEMSEVLVNIEYK